LFHARGPAAAKDRSPSDDIVCGTATELDVADLRPGLTVASSISRGQFRAGFKTIYNYIYSAAVLASRSLGVGPAGPLTSQNVNPVTFKRSSQEMSANSYTCQSGMAEA